MILQHVRHRDGSDLDRSEADALIARALVDPNFFKPDQRQEERLKRFAGPLALRMTGLYGFPLSFLFTWRPDLISPCNSPGN